jgi:hypothetical protein
MSYKCGRAVEGGGLAEKVKDKEKEGVNAP